MQRSNPLGLTWSQQHRAGHVRYAGFPDAPPAPPGCRDSLPTSDAPPRPRSPTRSYLDLEGYTCSKASLIFLSE